ncbi:hypothetical protein B1759_16550 [Rubrivirga sp. SAORIC476]|uniref:hypothetical protein n=1 Tax=Rubrivirga sp. SAORIC476 TaxID=1961794 RepID=UPI000BA8E1E0|nr:hypothetical protein [Rubrivirga sp. SAORIC476]PAP74789.1 hypothetical protein B1759_16550 [Rubrivirga sp. SAORIC476]
MSTRTWVAEGFLNEPDRWQHVVEWALPLADAVEFNVLFEGEEAERMVEGIDAAPQPLPTAKRMYAHSQRLRFALTDDLRRRLLFEPFIGWYNGPLEDPSLWAGDRPVMETITHEGYVYARLSETERQAMLEAGIDFQYEVPGAVEPAAVGRRWASVFLRWFRLGVYVALTTVLPSAPRG